MFQSVDPTGIPGPCRKTPAATGREAVPMAAPALRHGLRRPQICACVNEICAYVNEICACVNEIFPLAE